MASPNLKHFEYLVFKTILAWELRRDGRVVLTGGWQKDDFETTCQIISNLFQFLLLYETILAWEPQRHGLFLPQQAKG